MPRPRSAQQIHPGFTLAELLIALAILGVIATFTVPKVLNAQQSQQRKAVFKETISMLANVAANGVLKPDPAIYNANGDAHMHRVIRNNVNYIRECDSPGCYVASGTFSTDDGSANIAADQIGWKLPNGAYISGGSNGYGSQVRYLIDWNGDAPPNTLYDDVILVGVCWNIRGQNCAADFAAYANPAGRVGPAQSAPYRAAYNSLFE